MENLIEQFIIENKRTIQPPVEGFLREHPERFDDPEIWIDMSCLWSEARARICAEGLTPEQRVDVMLKYAAVALGGIFKPLIDLNRPLLEELEDYLTRNHSYDSLAVIPGHEGFPKPPIGEAHFTNIFK